LRDLGDKVSAEDRAETERRIEAVRTALKGSDLAEVKSSAESLADELQKVSTAAYKAAGTPPTPGPDDQAGGSSEAPSDQPGEDVVEGEYKEA
jgi:molecular chaperone DnaK